MKKFFRPISILLVLVLSASLTGCGGSSYNIFYFAKVGADAILSGDVKSNIEDALYSFNDGLYALITDAEQSLEEYANELAEEADKETSEDTDDAEDVYEDSTDEDSEIEDKNTDSKDDESVNKDKDSDTEESHEPTIDNDYLIDYYHYDIDKFTELCDKFVEAGKSNDADDIESTYTAVVDELKTIAELDGVCNLYYSADVNDEYYSTESAYSESLLNDASDAFYTACNEVYESEGSDTFAKIADDYVLESCMEYVPQTDEEKDLIAKESELVNEYNTALSNLDDCTYEYDGTVYSYSDLTNTDSELAALSIFHYSDFIKIYNGILKEVNDKLGPIYIDLVEIRAQLAEDYGYETYSDYCYEETYNRSYTTEEAQEFCDTVKEVLKEDSGLWEKIGTCLYYSDYVVTETTYDELFEDLEKAIKDYGDIYSEAYEELTTKKLYDFGDSSERLVGSYTTYIDNANIPFIYSNEGEKVSTFSTISHEFGHFSNYVYEISSGRQDSLKPYNLDIMEIHSNGLQLLLTNEYENLFGDYDAEYMKKADIADQLYQTVEGCKYDEFQRYIYEHPDMTLDEVNEYFGKLSEEYGGSASEEKYTWVFISHNYENPLYYLSYAVSSLSAMDIYLISTEDEEKAISTLQTVVEQPDEMSYEEVMEAAGLTKFYDTKDVKELLSDVSKLLDDVEDQDEDTIKEKDSDNEKDSAQVKDSSQEEDTIKEKDSSQEKDSTKDKDSTKEKDSTQDKDSAQEKDNTQGKDKVQEKDNVQK